MSGDIASVIASLAALLTGKTMNIKLENILRKIPSKTKSVDNPYIIPGISVAIEYW